MKFFYKEENEMNIVTVNPFGKPRLVEEIASVYQQSFGGDPWNEGYQCPVCEAVYPLVPAMKFCSECEKRAQTILVVEYWPRCKIISDFYREMRRPESICIACTTNERVIGFTWGYTVSANPDLDSHLDAPGIHTSLRGEFFYLDECAIVPERQGDGIGKVLVRYIFREQQQKQILLRTMNNSRMHRLIAHMGGEVIQSISRGRVIMRITIN